VDAMFRNFNDTSSKEQVVLLRIMRSNRQPYAYTKSIFNYVILVHPDRSEIGFEEYRTDSQGKSVRYAPDSSGLFVATSGFAAQSLYLHPNHQFGSRFR
jgi:hypothetical protein